ncbi:hypothetical protein ABEB36_011536 [Hypothenemus hampei]|uniref:Uncharacterized protein n=1 Tax=Hypothenemus hampei TaxID=57062 RepID=A0ABD1E860_HYPHA
MQSILFPHYLKNQIKAMWKPVLILTLFMEIVSNEAAKKVQCGGIYTATRGVLSTPNFPGPFAVPIKCQWVIDASNSISTNTSIIIYLTQLFTFEGLTFTEYQLYGNDYKIHPKIIHKVNESNVIRTKWIQTYQNYLVIDLKMQSGESAHLRVLDKFLDTYGFNITYEITTNGNVRVPSCTMMDCGFTGICLDHYTQFSCSCFDGYSGPNCSEGPKSYCYKNGTPTCKNGGTCLHVGVAAVKCHCSKLFTGNTCETPVDSAISKERQLLARQTFGQVSQRLLDTGSVAPEYQGRGRQQEIDPETEGRILNLVEEDSTKSTWCIAWQILKQLRLNVSKIEDLKVINLIHYTSGADVTFQVKTSSKTDERKVKNVLNKWIDRGYVGNITVTEKDNSMKTSLAVQSVDINQQGVIRENDEFILSCVARGSPSMTFRWFKDGTFVNLTYARRPLMKIEPMNLTVRKGQNFTVKCITSEGNGGTTGKYTYSWTKNKELLPVVTNTEKYETLYPTGTILQVFHAEKDATYSCLVQDVSTSSERSIDVIVIDRAGVHTCPNESSYDVHWPETAPDTDFMQNCPKDYLGTVSRRCMLNDGKHPTWNIPDFSYCTAKHMNEIFEKFEELKLGYATTNIDNLLYDFSKYVSTAHLRPGEGAKLLSFIQSMYTYLDRSKLDNKLVQGFANTVFQVLDRILSSANSLLNFKEINLIQIIIFDQFKLLDLYTTNWESFKSFKRPLNTLDIAIQTDYSHKDTVEYSSTLADRKLGSMSTWMSAKITAQQSVQPNNSNLLITVVYRNLSEFLPPKSFLRIGDGTEIEYQIFSQIITFSPVGHNRSIKDEGFNRLTIVFQHKFSTEMINISENEQWEIQCGFVDARSLAYTWDIYACYPEFIDKHSTRCVCPKFGSFVLLLVLTQIEETTLLTKEPDKYILICSFVFATILILFTTLCLVVSCVIARCSCILILKLQCSISLFVCEILFTLAILLEPSQVSPVN